CLVTRRTLHGFACLERRLDTDLAGRHAVVLNEVIRQRSWSFGDVVDEEEWVRRGLELGTDFLRALYVPRRCDVVAQLNVARVGDVLHLLVGHSSRLVD